MSETAKTELTPTGFLRAGINLGNGLLVSGRDADGAPFGVAPDVAREVAKALGVEVKLVPFDTPFALANAAEDDVWDIGLIGAEPERARTIQFTDAYVEIEAGYLVPAVSTISAVGEVDRPGNRIAVSAKSAYDLWLDRNIQHAELVRTKPGEKPLDLFRDQGLEVLAGLRSDHLRIAQEFPGSRVLDGHFTTVQQAIGVRHGKVAAAEFLAKFVADAKSSGLIQQIVSNHGMSDRLVAK
ncbi:transporter substrate-binding domain-containing protein [Mesorhizobium sp. SB112]|uniref:transporter substrate-binding domain-containing protein n=1 Tax=Mesorhizobium sp. SB112 TaxID=3151853 RepID=UPI00326526CC